MSTCVVDTDVVSFVFKGDSRADAYRPYLEDRVLSISFMTVAELGAWALERRWGRRRRAELRQHLAAYVVHESDPELCQVWAEVTHGTRRKGRRMECGDAWIAATALLHGVPLVTHNCDHYEGVDGLTLVSADVLG